MNQNGVGIVEASGWLDMEPSCSATEVDSSHEKGPLSVHSLVGSLVEEAGLEQESPF